MRLAGLVLSLILLAAGLLLGFVYPKAMEKASVREIGQWTLYSPEAGFAEAEATLSAFDGATTMTVAIRSAAPRRGGADREVLVLTVFDQANREIHRTPLDLSGHGTLESPQTGVVLYRVDAGTLDPVSGRHRLVLAAGRDFDDQILSVDLALVAAARDTVRPEARPAGIGLMVLGGIGLVVSLRRRRENPNSSPPPEKWGRRR